MLKQEIYWQVCREKETVQLVEMPVGAKTMKIGIKKAKQKLNEDSLILHEEMGPLVKYIHQRL